MAKDLKLIILTPYRKRLIKDVIITRGIDSCLVLSNEQEWEKIVSRLDNFCSKDKTSRHCIRFVNLMKKGAIRIEIGKNGKITIPDYLRQYANIKNKTLFIENLNHIELWAKEEFEKYREHYGLGKYNREKKE